MSGVPLNARHFWPTLQSVEVREQQRERLQRTIKWAHRIRAELQPLLQAHAERVHFRPSSSGVTMVGLLPDRPQRGKSKITNLKSLTDGFEAMFDAHCRNVAQGRVLSLALIRHGAFAFFRDDRGLGSHTARHA